MQKKVAHDFRYDLHKNDECQVLKRHVNFMKSSAEKTHLDQDVVNCYYSAVCLLLSDSYSRKSMQF
jgi:hypothetical protein